MDDQQVSATAANPPEVLEALKRRRSDPPLQVWQAPQALPEVPRLYDGGAGGGSVPHDRGIPARYGIFVDAADVRERRARITRVTMVPSLHYEAGSRPTGDPPSRRSTSTGSGLGSVARALPIRATAQGGRGGGRATRKRLARLRRVQWDSSAFHHARSQGDSATWCRNMNRTFAGIVTHPAELSNSCDKKEVDKSTLLAGNH